MLYCDAYLLMFEEGAIYFEEEQELALERAQVLMFFFVLQSLFDVAWEGQNGLEIIFQAFAPPFAKLPLRPPRGMEAAGAVIRGIIERARLMGDESVAESKKNLAVEAGEFQEQIREQFEEELFACKNLLSLFDEDADGEITLEEFIDGISQLPARGELRFTGVPQQALDLIIFDLATDLFDQIDDDGNGVLSNDEIKEAVEARRVAAQEARLRRGDLTANRMISNVVDWTARQLPGTEARMEAKEAKMARLKAIREAYQTYLKHRRMLLTYGSSAPTQGSEMKHRGFDDHRYQDDPLGQRQPPSKVSKTAASVTKTPTSKPRPLP